MESQDKCNSGFKLFEIIYLKTLIIVYKAKTYVLPKIVQTLFVETGNVHNYFTRGSSSGKFSVKSVKTKVKSMCISVKGVVLYFGIIKNIFCY